MGQKIEGQFDCFVLVAVSAVTPLAFVCLPLLLPVGR